MVQGVRLRQPRIFTNTAVKIWYLAEILSLWSFPTCTYQEHEPYALHSGAYWSVIPSHEWYALLELPSFQTVSKNHRRVLFIWIMLLVKDFKENAYIIAAGLQWVACQRIETTWGLVDARNRKVFVASVKHLNLLMLKLDAQTTEKFWPRARRLGSTRTNFLLFNLYLHMFSLECNWANN
jgi:hypothetical protein